MSCSRFIGNFEQSAIFVEGEFSLCCKTLGKAITFFNVSCNYDIQYMNDTILQKSAQKVNWLKLTKHVKSHALLNTYLTSLILNQMSGLINNYYVNCKNSFGNIIYLWKANLNFFHITTKNTFFKQIF